MDRYIDCCKHCASDHGGGHPAPCEKCFAELESSKPPRLPLESVLRDEYVDSRGAAAVAGIALQTLHNLRSAGGAPEPVGQLRYIGRDQMIYLRSDVEAWANKRRRKP